MLRCNLDHVVYCKWPGCRMDEKEVDSSGGCSI